MYPSMKLNATEWYPPMQCHDPECTKEHLTTRSGKMPFEGCHKQLYVQIATIWLRAPFDSFTGIRVLHFSRINALCTTFSIPDRLLSDCSLRPNRRIALLQEALKWPLLPPLITIIGEYLKMTLEEEVMKDSLEVFNSVNQSNCVPANKSVTGIDSEWGMFKLFVFRSSLAKDHGISAFDLFLTTNVGFSPFSQLVKLLDQNRDQRRNDEVQQAGERAINVYNPQKDPKTGCTIL